MLAANSALACGASANAGVLSCSAVSPSPRSRAAAATFRAAAPAQTSKICLNFRKAKIDRSAKVLARFKNGLKLCFVRATAMCIRAGATKGRQAARLAGDPGSKNTRANRAKICWPAFTQKNGDVYAI